MRVVAVLLVLVIAAQALPRHLAAKKNAVLLSQREADSDPNETLDQLDKQFDSNKKTADAKYSSLEDQILHAIDENQKQIDVSEQSIKDEQDAQAPLAAELNKLEGDVESELKPAKDAVDAEVVAVEGEVRAAEQEARDDREFYLSQRKSSLNLLELVKKSRNAAIQNAKQGQAQSEHAIQGEEQSKVVEQQAFVEKIKAARNAKEAVALAELAASARFKTQKALDDFVAEMDETIAYIRQHIALLDESEKDAIATRRNIKKQLDDKLAAVQERQKLAAAAISDAEVRIAELKTQVAASNDKISAIEEHIKETKSVIAGLQDGLAKVRARIAEGDEFRTKLASTTKRLREIISADSNPNAAEAVSEVADKQVETLETWKMGDWSDFSATCGSAVHTREVTCVNLDGDVVADSKCQREKPATSETVELSACPQGQAQGQAQSA